MTIPTVVFYRFCGENRVFCTQNDKSTTFRYQKIPNTIFRVLKNMEKITLFPNVRTKWVFCYKIARY